MWGNSNIQKRVTSIFLVVALLLLPHAVFAANGGQGYCGHPYLNDASFAISDRYCSTDPQSGLPYKFGLRSEGVCCPDDGGLYGTEIYDGESWADGDTDFIPADQLDCATNYFVPAGGGYDNLIPCKLGCCVLQSSCIASTEYQCSGSGSTFGEGFTDSADPCVKNIGGDVYWYHAECDAGGLSCNSITSVDICTVNGCVWCDANGNDPSCLASCQFCSNNRIFEENNICVAETTPCDSYGSQQACTDSFNCRWCPGNAQGYCVDVCSVDTCPQPQDSDGDRVCDLVSNCQDFTPQGEISCANVQGCLWCPDLADGIANNAGCVADTCTACTLNSPPLAPTDTSCVGTCNDGFDNPGSFSGTDAGDPCCAYNKNDPGASEDYSCVVTCQESLRISESTGVTIDGDTYCTCGVVNGVPSLYNTQDADQEFCCMVSGSLQVVQGGCNFGSQKICMYKSPNVPLVCSSGQTCPVVVKDRLNGRIYPWGVDDWENNCVTIENIPYPTELVITASYPSDSTLGTHNQIYQFTNDGSDYDVILPVLDQGCFAENLLVTDAITFEVAPDHCFESPLTFSWELKSGLTGEDCFSNMIAVEILDSKGNIVQSVTDSVTMTQTRSIQLDSDQTGLYWGDSELFSLRVKMSCDIQDTSCPSQTYAITSKSVLASPGDARCQYGGGYCVPGESYKYCYTDVGAPNQKIVYCDPYNVFATHQSCEPFAGPLGEFCRLDENGIPECVGNYECTMNIAMHEGNVFGMFYSNLDDKVGVEGCLYDEYGGPSRPGGDKFCYFDVSETSVDMCFACDLDTTCYDYAGKDACVMDHCRTELEGVADCLWHDNGFDELGKGYCYAPTVNVTDQCHRCSDENSNIASEGFMNENCDSPTCDILGACYSIDFADEVDARCLACKVPERFDEPTTCYDMKDQYACIGSDGNSDASSTLSANYQVVDIGCMQGTDAIAYPCNTELQSSYDQCGIGRCQWAGAACVKDNNFDGIDDCNGDHECEKDAFALETNIRDAPEFIAQHTMITIEIDAEDPFGWDDPDDIANYQLFYCLGSSDDAEPCIPKTAATQDGDGRFTIYEDPLDDLMGPTGDGVEGLAHLRYFTVDQYDNIQPIQTEYITLFTKIPQVEWDIESFKNTDNTHRLHIEIKSIDRMLDRCGICAAWGIENTDMTHEECRKSTGTRITGILSGGFIEPYETPDDLLLIDYPSIAVNGLKDGVWAVALKCQDAIYDTYYNDTKLLYFDVERPIADLYPERNIFNVSDVTGGDVRVSFNTPNKRLSCFLKGDYTGSTDWQSGWTRYDHDGTEAFCEDPCTSLDATWMYDMLISTNPSEANLEGYHQFDVTCGNWSTSAARSCYDYSPFDGRCLWGNRTTEFVVDTKPPMTTLKFGNVVNGDLLQDFNASVIYTSTEFSIACDDNTNDIYGDIGPFGCDKYYYCFNAFPDTPCTLPEKAANYKTANLAGINYALLGSSDMVNAKRDFTVCYASEDEGVIVNQGYARPSTLTRSLPFSISIKASIILSSVPMEELLNYLLPVTGQMILLLPF